MAKSFQKSRNPVKEAKEFDEEVVQIDRVTRVVKGGRRLRFRATVVIGNHKGKIGMGIGKANEVSIAIRKGVEKAKKNIMVVPMTKDTIPHEIRSKFKSSKVLMMPARTGTGMIAGGAVRKVMELTGIKNILSKSFGSNNRVNTTKATLAGLASLATNQYGMPKVMKEATKPAPAKPEKKETKKEQESAKAE